MTTFTIGWGLLNLGLAIALFVISYRNFRIYSERYGRIASGILLLVSAAMCHSPVKKYSTGDNPAAFETRVPAALFQENGSHSYYVQLADFGFSQLTQGIIVNQPVGSDTVQLSSFVTLSGFMSGIYWTPISTSVTAGADRQLRYQSTGTIQWQLLGLPVYTQTKHFTGIVPASPVKAQ